MEISHTEIPEIFIHKRFQYIERNYAIFFLFSQVNLQYILSLLTTLNASISL